MSYHILVKPAYLSDLVGLPHHVAKRLTKVASELAHDPVRVGGNIKKLAGYDNLYRYRIGDYRLIYAVAARSNCVDLLVVGPRKNVYDRFLPSPDLPQAPIPEIEPVAVHEPVPQFGMEEVMVRPSVEVDTRAEGPPAEELPRFTREDLEQWRIPAEHSAELLRCRTDEELFAADVPARWKDRLLDRLYPKPIAMVAAEPGLVVHDTEDLDRFVEGQLADFLLQLDPKQEEIVGRALEGPTLVKGGPGSGKSTVALYRVKALAEAGYASGDGLPSILFTTCTNALTTLSEQLLEQILRERPRRLEVRTVDSLAMSIVGASEPGKVEIASGADRRRALGAARRTSGVDLEDLDAFLEAATVDSLPGDYLLEEFDWVIEGQRLGSFEEYAEVPRTGRGIAFDRDLRRRVWEIYETFRSHLGGRWTWGRIRSRALELVESGEHRLRFDYVLVDEAQDLTPTALRPCVAVCGDPKGLFLAADAGQSLYNRGFAWSRVHEGLRFVGRTRILRRNYRSTRQLGEAASDVMRGVKGADPETLSQEFLREGPRPVVRGFAHRADQYRWLAEEVRRAARALRLSAGAAAVLCADRKLGEEAARELRQAGLKAEFMEGRSLRLDSPAVKVMTVHSAKGLEFPIVALPAVEEGVVPLPPQEGDDREAHELAQRCLFHVAVSRAMRRLFAATRKGAESPYLHSLSSDLWEWEDGSPWS